MDYSQLMGGLMSGLGKSSGGSGVGGGGASQSQTQQVTQTQSNVQSVNVGSNLGGQPATGDLLDNLLGTVGAPSVALTPTRNYTPFILGGVIIVGLYLYYRK